MDTNTLQVITQFGEKVDGYISVLADKAGMAAEQFWPVLIKQQVIEGWSGIGYSIFGLVILGLVIKTLINNAINFSDEDALVSKKMIKLILGGIIGLATFFETIFNVGELSTNVAKINNPEYYAVQSLVKMVK